MLQPTGPPGLSSLRSSSQQKRALGMVEVGTGGEAPGGARMLSWWACERDSQSARSTELGAGSGVGVALMPICPGNPGALQMMRIGSDFQSSVTSVKIG